MRNLFAAGFALILGGCEAKVTQDSSGGPSMSTATGSLSCPTTGRATDTWAYEPVTTSTCTVCSDDPEICTNLHDDDDDRLVDCADPGCAGDAACAVGTATLGSDCEVHSDCAASRGQPLCAFQSKGGFCTEFCAPGESTCGPCGACVPADAWSGLGYCVKTCGSDKDCAASERCMNIHTKSLSTSGCLPYP